MSHWVVDISKHFGKIGPSQDGIDGCLPYVFDNIGTTNKVCVDFGAIDGHILSNTQLLEKELGFSRILIDRKKSKNPDVHVAKLTVENVNDVFEELGVPENFDLLNIDIDGNDYWIWKAIECIARVVIIEYNPGLGYSVSKTVEYDPNFQFNKNQYFGASAGAYRKLGKKLGYKLVAYSGLNLMFIRSELIPDAPYVEFPENENVKRGWGPAPKDSKWISV